MNKFSLTEDKVKIESVNLSEKKIKLETVEKDSKEVVLDIGKSEVQCENCGKKLKGQKTYESHQRYYQGKCKPRESLGSRHGYDPGRVSQRMSSEESIKKFSLTHMSHNSANLDFSNLFIFDISGPTSIVGSFPLLSRQIIWAIK